MNWASQMLLPRFTLFAICSFFLACEEEQPKVEVVRSEPVSGQIVIYNSCGILGAAEESREFLRARGFDVLNAQTDPQWTNYEETIIAIRNPHWAGYNQLKENLDTKNFIILQDTLSGNISATIFLGKDYRKVLKKRTL
ncbi:MAG: LytR C-terminal domain-containing protein [Fibromonadales bacterium]|nr:LytR C-terminal domain-containing protein [Fibromonadales bacterium]